MTELLWQTVLLLAGAFFFGAVLACSLKRRFYYGPPGRAAAAAGAGSLPAGAASEANADQPKIEVASRPAAQGERFERALSGTARQRSESPRSRSRLRSLQRPSRRRRQLRRNNLPRPSRNWRGSRASPSPLALARR
jgi:hypothetical protein